MELSVLNVVPRRIGETEKEAMDQMVALAQGVEDLGYTRYWIAEHHNTKAFVSSATSLLIQHTLANTKSIRVGAGGVMLPNHTPYVVAEYYGTLETLYPGRVDLGLGRAPGTDMQTARAIRRTVDFTDKFPQEVQELEGYFKDSWPVHAYPAAGLNVPLYILGSSTDSAYLAAELGLPYAFASHFAPAMLEQAVKIYKDHFKPSKYLAYPYVIVGVNVTAADTDEEAERLETSKLQGMVDIVLGRGEGIKPPVDNREAVWDNLRKEIRAVPHFGPVAFNEEDLLRDAKAAVQQMGSCQLVGSVESIKKQYRAFKSKVQFDEMMVNTFIFDPKAQLRSFALLKQAVDEVE